MTDQPTTVVNVKTDEYDVYIGRANNRRGLKKSYWANPYVVGRDGTRDEVIEKYRRYVLSRPPMVVRLPELRGKRLGCWCHPEKCHGDVLAELANAIPTPTPTPAPAPMSEERIAELRNAAEVMVHDAACGRNGFDATHSLFAYRVLHCLAEITRLRSVVAEQEAEIARLSSDNGWLRYWLHYQTGWDIDREMQRAPSVFLTSDEVPDER